MCVWVLWKLILRKRFFLRAFSPVLGAPLDTSLARSHAPTSELLPATLGGTRAPPRTQRATGVTPGGVRPRLAPSGRAARRLGTTDARPAPATDASPARDGCCPLALVRILCGRRQWKASTRIAPQPRNWPQGFRVRRPRCDPDPFPAASKASRVSAQSDWLTIPSGGGPAHERFSRSNAATPTTHLGSST